MGFKNEEKNDGTESVSGAVEHITYHNEDNGYTVCRISRDNSAEVEEMATLVGIMPMIKVGETIKAMGRWIFHQTFGRQFSVEYFEKELPTNISAIMRYLSSGAVKGIGPKTAAKIVGLFGEKTFEIIENSPEELTTIQGISKNKAMQISGNFKEQFGVRAVMMFCRDHFGPSTAMKIYKRWGGGAVDIMKKNPYILCDEINGIGFERADKVASSLGIDQNSPERIRSGMIYVLTYNANQNGHTYVPRERLISLTSSLLKVSDEECGEALDVLTATRRVVDANVNGRSCIFLKKYYDAELYIKGKLDLLESECTEADKEKASDIINLLQERENLQYDAMQYKAIKNSLEGGVLIVTGGPGTGKTTIIRGIIHLFEGLGESVVLAAPTGRASKRMTAATGREAKTIHRMLEMVFTDQKEPKFMRDSNNPLDYDVIIIDEASMVDTLLMHALLEAISTGSRLILIGDADQLPPVGAGNALGEILASERYRTIILKKIFRQAGESLIVTNAHAINSGELPELDSKNKDFFFIHRESDAEIAETVANLYVNRLPKKYGQTAQGQIQVITPSHKGAAGTDSLNIMLQGALNPQSNAKKEKKFREKIFREGDRVMQVKNNYDILWERDNESGFGIFNGDMGVILEIDNSEESMQIDFDGRITVYDFTMLDELEHSYAITVHKSQGSEYPFVIMPLYQCGDRLLTRNLLYTAVTRAQELVVLVGRADIVERMVHNNRQTKRYTGLKYFLTEHDE